jgi:UDP-galactopyranose mutase
MFENMLDHPRIKVLLQTDYREVMDAIGFKELIYSGPIDEFFDYRFGKLPYRSLTFKHETLAVERFQPVAVVNYPNEYAFTRITEFKHMTGQKHEKTSIVYEYPQDEGDPYYPVPRKENSERYTRYQELAREMPEVHFVGRLGTYRYYNMDQIVGQSLTMYKRIKTSQNGHSRDRILPPLTPTVPLAR